MDLSEISLLHSGQLIIDINIIPFLFIDINDIISQIEPKINRKLKFFCLAFKHGKTNGSKHFWDGVSYGGITLGDRGRNFKSRNEDTRLSAAGADERLGTKKFNKAIAERDKYLEFEKLSSLDKKGKLKNRSEELDLIDFFERRFNSWNEQFNNENEPSSEEFEKRFKQFCYSLENTNEKKESTFNYYKNLFDNKSKYEEENEGLERLQEYLEDEDFLEEYEKNKDKWKDVAEILKNSKLMRMLPVTKCKLK